MVLTSKKFWHRAVWILRKNNKISIICRIIGKTRQAYYKALKLYNKRSLSDNQAIAKVQYLRLIHPKIGTRKLQYILAKFHDINIGRDKLFSLLREHNMLIKRKRKILYFSTNKAQRSNNKVRNIEINAPGQVMYSDITYLKSKKRDYYLALVVDAYSRKIIGYNLSGSLEASQAKTALKQAIDQSHGKYKIHHSDGGIQYICKEYKDFLAENNIESSMTKPASPQENPVVERINGILKHEYGLKKTFDNYEEMLAKTKMAITIYNNIRPHWSLNLQVPNLVHQKVSTNFRT